MADLRKCIGSARFGIEAHEAPVADFPVQPSQKARLGRMCKPPWNAYTTALRKAAVGPKVEDGAPEPESIQTKLPRAGRKAPEPVAENAEAGTV